MDLKTGICTDVGDLGAKFSSLTFDKSGILYATTGNGASPPEAFFEINKANADTTFLTNLGAGADGEIVCYNSWDNRFFHWSGNATVEYEKFLHTPPYTATSISSGPPAFEIFGAVCLSANRFIVSTINNDFRYVDTLGNFSTPIASLPADFRGLVFGINFAVSDDTICSRDTVNVSATGANVYDYDVIYAWGDGTRDTVPDGGDGSHIYFSTGYKTLNIILYNQVCEEDTIASHGIMVFNIPAVAITPTVDTILCIGDTIRLFGSSGGTSQWYMDGLVLPGASTPSLDVTVSGIYNMTKTNLNGCTDSAAVGAMIYFTFPFAGIDSTASDTTYVGVSEDFLNTSTGFTDHIWDYGDLSPADTSYNGNHAWDTSGTYTVTLIVTLGDCADTVTHNIVVLDTVVTGVQPFAGKFLLHPAVPNPFSQSTEISLELPVAGDTHLVIYDLMGGGVTTLCDGSLPAGVHSFTWDGTTAAGTRMSPGFYFCTMEFRGEKRSIKLLLQP
jgi:PKD repeat protein